MRQIGSSNHPANNAMPGSIARRSGSSLPAIDKASPASMQEIPPDWNWLSLLHSSGQPSRSSVLARKKRPHQSLEIHRACVAAVVGGGALSSTRNSLKSRLS